MTGKIPYLVELIVFCLLFVACRVPLAAALTFGYLQVSELSTTSGGGRAENGSLAMNVANIGGVTNAGAILRGANFSVTTGGTPAVVTFNTAKSDLSGAHCYPVPFKPSAGHTKITFTELTKSVRIRIYTISGELVRTLTKSNGSKALEWNVRNSQGAVIDSGVYLYLIESPTQPKKGKLMIIR